MDWSGEKRASHTQDKHTHARTHSERPGEKRREEERAQRKFEEGKGERKKADVFSMKVYMMLQNSMGLSQNQGRGCFLCEKKKNKNKNKNKI